MITFELFCPVYNEEYMLPFMIKHYQDCVGKENIRFNIYDNGSIDDTVKIALSLGCHVGVYETEAKVNDELLRDFKNNIWNNSRADYVIVIDCDEFIDIDIKKLSKCTIARCEGYDMLGYGDQNPLEIIEGIRHKPEDKVCVFSPNAILEMNYEIGAHDCQPSGVLRWTPGTLRLYHMKAHSLGYMIKKFRESKERLSETNKKNNWGSHYNMTDQEIIDFHTLRYNKRETVR